MFSFIVFVWLFYQKLWNRSTFLTWNLSSWRRSCACSLLLMKDKKSLAHEDTHAGLVHDAPDIDIKTHNGSALGRVFPTLKQPRPWMDRKSVISYFILRNYWLIWPPFSFIVGLHLLFGIPFTFMKQNFLLLFFNFKTALLIKLAFYARISSESIAPLWFSDVVHNAKRWILKTRVGKSSQEFILNEKKKLKEVEWHSTSGSKVLPCKMNSAEL